MDGALVFLNTCIFQGGAEKFCFWSQHRNIDGVVWRGFLVGGKILYLEPKRAFKEIKVVRNKHQEDSTDG